MDKTRTHRDAQGRPQTPDGMEARVREQIGQIERERAEFMVVAPVRAEEQMRAMQAQLQMEISMRIAHYELQIETLKGLLAEPAKETD